jgi:predicted ribosomally synthesized peptide with SipW-like signal peptide
MSSTRSHPRLMFLGMVALVVAALGGGAMSLALFTDSDAVGANTFSTVSIVLNTSPTSALVTYAGMYPGDTTGPQVLTVSNDGTGELRYSMTSASTDADSKHLRTQLVLDVTEEDTGGGCVVMDGASVYSGVLGATTAKFGDPFAGDDTGDRTLAAGSNEVLCFKVTLPDTTGNAYQAAATTTTFTFASEQTYANP